METIYKLLLIWNTVLLFVIMYKIDDIKDLIKRIRGVE